MSSPSIFDAFFWIEPVRGNAKSSNSTKVLWNYPDDVSSVVEEFKDIPEFCFPDLQRVALEKAQNTRSEHYTFTLTDASGKRVYGICMRTLFRGVTRRYDVKRRVRHCLCVITRYPFFKFFKSVLMELHAVALLEERPGCCRQFIDCIYRLADVTTGREQRLTIPRHTISAMYAEYALLRPKVVAGAGMASKEVPILPLFDTLGTERFFKLLSAVLCEKRIVFIAEEAETLSATVLAAANMLHPFKWHHMFIPLLPGKLLSLLQGQAPYMIGVRKYLLSELRRDSLDGTVVVDCDSGEVRLQGQVHVRDLIGDAATARKQASESLDQMKAKMSGMASMFMGKAGSEGPQDIGPKDLMVVLLSDLKSSVTSTKPSSYTISSLLGGGLNRSVEEAKMQWALDAEKALRDNLTVFFVYFFADLEEYMTSSAATGGVTGGFGTLSKSADTAPRRMAGVGSDGSGNANDVRGFPVDDSRSNFDLKSYLHKRNQMGDSRQLLGFLQDFVNAQVFERFCGEMIVKKQAQVARLAEQSKRKSMAATSGAALSTSAAGRGGVQSLPSSLSGSSLSGAGDEDVYDVDDVYECAVREWNQRAQSLTITNVKLAVAAASPSGAAGKEMGSNFHNLAVQFTSSATPLAPCETEVDRDSQYYTSYLGNTNMSTADTSANRDSAKRAAATEGMLRRIIADAGDGDEFLCIMRTIHFRLQGCLAASSRGSAGVSGVRALNLCRSLLIEGPECVLTYAVDFIPTLRAILHLSQSLDTSGAGAVKKTSKQQQALDYMSLGAFMDPTEHTRLVLDLILDHKKLTVQRKVCVLLKKGSFPFLTTPATSKELRTAQYARTEMLFTAQYSSSKLFPKFDSLHNSLNLMGLPAVKEGTLKLTTPELAVGAVEDRQNGGDDDDDVPGSSSYARTSARESGANSPGRSGAAAASPASAPPSALASYTTASANKRGSQAPAPAPAVKVTKERFIYSDDDDSTPAAPAPNASRPFAATGAAAAAPPKPERPDSGRQQPRAQSPFKTSDPAPASKITPFAPTVAAATAPAPAAHAGKLPAPREPSSANRRGSVRTAPVDLLDFASDLPATTTPAAVDPFAMDAFLPSLPAAVPASDPFAPSFPGDSFAPTVAPTTAAVDDFAPSTSWGGASTAGFATTDPFAPTAATATVNPFDAFAPTVAASDPFGAAFPGPTGGVAFAASTGFDDFAPTVPSASPAPFMMPPPAAGGIGFIHTKPPAAAQPAAADPFDFLNPIKK